MKWWTKLWNPVTGCTKVSEGCKHCYAESQWPRFQKLYNGRAFTDVACHSERLSKPLSRKKPTRYFVNSMSDLFHPGVPYDFIDKVFAIMALCPQHTFMICTKRADRMQQYCSDRLKEPPQNVYLGVTAENQPAADERVTKLLATPAAKRFISAEPLLSHVNLKPWLMAEHGRRLIGAHPGIDMVIAGGESGPKARPTHPNCFRSLRDQCAAADVPYFFKQWGEWAPNCLCDTPIAHKTIKRPEPGKPGYMFRCGKKNAGRLLDGIEHNEYPEDGL